MATVPSALAVAALVLSQAPAQPPTFRARIDLVQVDVVVIDRDGAPVRGLQTSDFTLFDRGAPQAIVNVDEVSHARPRAAATMLPAAIKKDVADNQSAQAGRLVVMVVDDLHIYRERTDRAKEIARRVLTDLGPESSMAVLFTSGDHSTQVTDDPATLRAAVETLKGRQSWRRPHTAVDRQRGGRIDAEMSAEQQLAAVQKTQEASAQDFFDNLSQYKMLQDAARMLGMSDARRKAFVLVSEGIGKDLSGLFGAMAAPGEAPEGGVDYAGGNVAALASTAGVPYHDNALVDMMESLRRSNVATYAIDPRGKVESKDLARECFPPPHAGEDPCSNGLTDWVSPVRQAQHGLAILSEASGGFAVTNTDDFASGLRRIVDDLDHYYLLGFYPADTKGKGYRRIDVRIPGRPDLKVRFRHGYLPGGPPPAPKNTRETVALAAGVLPKADLPLRLSAIPLPGDGAASRVVLTLEVSPPRRPLEEADGKVRDTLKYEVLIVDEKKAKVRSVSDLEAHVTLSPIDAARVAPDVASYQVSETLEVLPGHYEFRVSAVSTKLAKGGSVYLAVDVPDFRASGPLVSGIVVNYAEGARVPTAARAPAPARQAAARGGMILPPPPSALPFPPTLDRAFAASETLRVYFEASERDRARLFPSVEIVDASDKVVRSVSPSFTSGDPVRVAATIALVSLPPGPYVLRVSVTDGSHSATRDLGFAIR
jgi:VWFA-related protein